MEPISMQTLIEKAKTEHRNTLRKMNYYIEVSKEDFRKLFFIRAQQAMAKRKNFKQFEIDDNNRHILNVMYHYVLQQKTCEVNPYIGIILQGDWGCGKSVLIEAFCMILNDITLQSDKKIQVIHALELAEDIRQNGIVPYTRIPLCIQDLGKEKLEMKIYGNEINPITELLAVRAEYGSLTFGTTNLSFENFGKAYQTYIAKRILEHVNWIHLPGGNRRPDYTLKA